MTFATCCIPKKLPLLLLQNTVILPLSLNRISVNSSDNINVVKSRVLNKNTLSSIIIGVVSKNDGTSFESKDAGSIIGTAAIVVQVTGTNWPQPAYTLLVRGLCRFRLEKLIMMEPYKVGFVTQLDYLDKEEGIIKSPAPEIEELIQEFHRLTDERYGLQHNSPSDEKIFKTCIASFPITSLIDMIISMTSAPFEAKYEILNTLDCVERLQKAVIILQDDMKGLNRTNNIEKDPKASDLFDSLNIPNRIQILWGRAKPRVHNNGDKGSDNDFDILREKIIKAKMPEYALKVAMKELKRLMNIGSFNPETAVIRNYLELMVELPWAVSSNETIDIRKARKDLNGDHHAMDKLKQRVLEYLAVRQIKNNIRAPILCFIGPPGVGKTSIGRSIANTLGRQFYRISLGGVNSQSHIRGHRRTYVGAMPGRIIEGLKTVGVNNPVILLDEIDKMDTSHGNPAAALLEVLDPEVNNNFVDHYLNVPFDLSQVIFIATANRINGIPAPLLDRMEVIHVNGYTEEEKVQIAEKYLMPKQLADHGLDDSIIKVPTDSIRLIITSYTDEAGVRSLERKIGALCRAVAVRVAENQVSQNDTFQIENTKEDNAAPPSFPIVIDEAAVEDILGPSTYDSTEMLSHIGIPGIAVGLAWTATGGKLTIVEASKLIHGEGNLVLTGHLGDVMKESAKIALNWVRTVACRNNIIDNKGEDLLADTDIHIHFPAGAIEKDGPSAGVTIATALVSLFWGIPVASDIAMTGEITLRGVVLPVGGVKEKVLAAHRAGYRRVILPKRSSKDLFYIPENVKNDMIFIFVNNMEEVLEAAFTVKPTPSTIVSKL
uniref:Lon protease homolog n=1 Tax=Clastoptera arizonana TaxID=38151 RepID=A0A1B6E326_9HEMI